MINFYSGIISICIISLVSLAIDVGKNTLLSHTDIKRFRFTFIMVACGACCEWLGIIFNEVIQVPNFFHYFVTLTEYCITPYLAVMFTRSCGFKLHSIAIIIVMSVHALIELIFVHFGLIFSIDETGHFVAGPIYNIYMIFAFLSLVYTIFAFAYIGRKKGLNNSLSLFFIIIIVIIGQISCINDGIIFSGYISVTIGAILLYNYFQFFLRYQMINTITMEQQISNQDPLTGVSSRICFERKVLEIDKLIKENSSNIHFAIAEFDLNNLKYINDGFGHDCGDEYIKRCCRFVCNYFKHSQIFRIGGDEFVVFVQEQDLFNMDSIITELRNFSIEEAQKNVDFSSRTSYAIGYSFFDSLKDKNIANVLKRADIDMYQNKKEVKSILFSH